jgi:HSP20 family protein
MSIFERSHDEEHFSLNPCKAFNNFVDFNCSLHACPCSSSTALCFPFDNSSLAIVRIDWKETPLAHLFKVDLPGLTKEEVQVQVEDSNILQISGKRTIEKDDNIDKWHCFERRSGDFLRRFRLPENANVDQISAAMESGLLTITVPKKVKKLPVIRFVLVSG